MEFLNKERIQDKIRLLRGKRVFTVIVSILVSVFLVAAVVTAITTIGDDVSVGNDLSVSGTITNGTWNGTTIDVAYGGTATSTAPSLGQMLIGNASGTYSYVASSSLDTSQILYDAVVDVNGNGDYTSVVTAAATEAEGATIFIKSGTYTEVADVILKNKQKLIGESKYDTIIDFNNQAYQVYANSLADGVHIRNLQVINSADTNGAIYVQTSPFSVLDNLIVRAGTTITNGIQGTSDDSVLSNSYITGFTGSAHYSARFEGNRCRIYGNRFENGYRNLRTGGNDTVVNGNIFTGSTEDAILVGSNGAVIVGNQITISSGDGVNCNGGSVTIIGNEISGGNVGVRIGGYDNNIVVGNRLIGNSISISNGADDNIILGNYLSEGKTVSSSILDSHGTIIKNNRGSDNLKERDYKRMKNTSGDSLAAGDIVIFKAVAGSSAVGEVTTTTTQGDDLVFGMAQESISNNNYGDIQTLGKTTKLKVNGTTDIAVGDFIGTYTEAGIGMKAAAGDMAIAIALEVYTTNDSSGVIDALIITPRKL